MIRQADRFSMHIARGGKGVTNGLGRKTLLTVCAIIAFHQCAIIIAVTGNSFVVNNAIEV